MSRPRTPPASPVRVLFFYPNEFFGSVWTVLALVIRHVDPARVTPYVVLNRDAHGEPGLSAAGGLTIRRWPFGVGLRDGLRPALLSALCLPGSMLALARYARQERIEVIHCAGDPRPATLGWFLARLTGARLVLHYHSVPGHYDGLRRFVEFAAARRADRAVAVSRFIAAQIPRSGVPAERIDVVLNGTNLRKFHPDVDGAAVRRELGIAPDAPLIVQLGRIYQGKRQEDVVRAFALARRRVPALRCLLVGWEDPRYQGRFPGYRAELAHIAAEADLGDSLLMLPARPDAPALLAAADLVALPSLDDPCPLTVIEAQASGRPVVAAASGGVPELVVDGETGFLVPQQSPDALAEQFVRLAADPALRARMGAAARRHAETALDEARLGPEFTAIYERLAGVRAPADRPAAALAASQV